MDTTCTVIITLLSLAVAALFVIVCFLYRKLVYRNKYTLNTSSSSTPMKTHEKHKPRSNVKKHQQQLHLQQKNTYQPIAPPPPPPPPPPPLPPDVGYEVMKPSTAEFEYTYPDARDWLPNTYCNEEQRHSTELSYENLFKDELLAAQVKDTYKDDKLLENDVY
ncbi:uncharacterized protein [Antedon mediterranea]|uniref:uncharacterized protein n=1 Tax=Antedon mediterranea TaxID=105859 RepID=UPI003AF5FF4A